MEEERIIAYKGFDENLCCKGFQYEVGKEYEQEGEIECCVKGFHACANPFDVLSYYEVNGKNRFCEVEQMGVVRTGSDGTKQSSSKIKIKAEIGMVGLFKAGVEWIKEKTNPKPIIKETKGNGGASSGNAAKIGSSGYAAKIGSSGYAAQIGSSGYAAKIGSSGNAAQIGSSGNAAQIGSSGNAAKIGSSGDAAQIGSSGDAAQIDSTGGGSVVCCAGNNCTAKASIGSWITLAEWKYSDEREIYVPVCVKTEFVDGERIKADTWYKLIDGEFKEI